VQLDDLIALHGEAARVEKTSFPYDDGGYFYVHKERLETDAEFEARRSLELARIADREKRDLLEFERLSLKFGGAPRTNVRGLS